MSTSSPDRFALYEMMRDAWGEPLATALTALTARLPPMHLSDLATKHDVEHSSILLRGDMSELRGDASELRAELRGEMSELRTELRTEMADLRAGLRGEMAELRTDLRTEMSELRSEVRGDIAVLAGSMSELRAEFRASSRHTIITIVAAAVSIWLTCYLPQVL